MIMIMIMIMIIIVIVIIIMIIIINQRFPCCIMSTFIQGDLIAYLLLIISLHIKFMYLFILLYLTSH